MRSSSPIRYADFGIAFAVSAAVFVVYRAFPDAYRNLGGVVVSALIADPDAGLRSAFVDSRHFLFGPTAWLFFRVLRAVSVARAGYEAIQILNAFWAAAAVGVLLLLFRRAVGTWKAALPLGLLLAHSYSYWSRAVECSVHAPGLFWTAAAIYGLWSYHESLSRRALAVSAACTALAVLYHLGHAVWLPAAAVFVLLKRRRDLPLFLGISTAGAVLPFLGAFRGAAATIEREPAGGKAWLDAFWVRPGVDSPAVHLGLLAAGLAVGALVVFRAVRGSSRDELKKHAPFLLFAALAAGFAGIAAFFLNAEWAGNAVVVMALAAAAGTILRCSFAKPLAGLWVLWGLTFSYNLLAGIRPHSRWENNVSLQKALFIGRNTEPGSVVVLPEAAHEWGKAYIPVFARRRVLFREETQDTDLQGLAEKGAPLYTVSGAGGRGDPGSVPPGFRPSDGERFSADFGLVRLWPSTAPLSAWESYYLAARRNNRTEDAIYSLRRRAQLMPGPAGWKELASVSAKTGRVEEAREALKNALSYLPGDVWSLLMTARLAWEAGDEKTAMDYARRLPEEQERFLLEEFRKAKQDGAVGDSRRRKD